MSKPRLVPRWAHAAFMRIAEPRVQRVLALASYLVSIGGGLSAWMAPPRTIEGVLGPILTLVWGFFLLAGGLTGAAVVLRGVWWVERIAVVSCLTGIAIYGSVVVYLHATESGSRLMQLTIVCLSLLLFITRWTEIRRYSYDPES